jgi:low temperature requirement protein LtrA
MDRRRGKEERRVGRLELFHGLVFFVVIAQLSREPAADVSLRGAARFALLLVPV